MAESERLGASFSIDISSLKSGLQQANRLIRESNSEFKAAAAGMGDWTKSEEGLTAKLKNLNSVADLQNKKIKALQAEYDKCVADGLDPMSAAAIKMRTDINNEKAALEKTQSAIRNYSASLSSMRSENESAVSSADKLRKKVEEQGQKLSDLKEKLINATIEQGKYSKEARKLQSEIDDLTEEIEENNRTLGESVDASEEATGGFTIMKGALADLVADGFRKAIDASKEFISGMFDTAAEVKAANSQFSQTFGELEGDANDSINAIAKKTGILDTRLKGTGAGIYAFAKSSGADSAEAMTLMEEALMATADSAAYYDKSLEDSAETLQSFLKGNFANDAALGVSATEFTRNEKAAELFGKKFNDLTEIQKQKTLLKMVTDAQKASGAFGQAARESDGWENVMGNLDETWKQFQAKVGTPFLEAIIPVIQDITDKFAGWAESVDWDAFADKVSDALNGVKDFGKWIIDNGDYILSLMAGIGAGFVAFKVVGIIQGVTKAMEGMTLAQAALNFVMSMNPIGLIVAAIAALVAAFVVLWNKCEGFRNFWIGLWDGIKNVAKAVGDWFVGAWQAIGKFFTGMWDGVKNGAKNAWEGIKNVFSNVTGWFKDKFTAAWTAVKNVFSTGGKIFSGIKEGIENTFKTVVNKIISGINKMIAFPFNAINRMLNRIRNTSFLGISPFANLWGENPLSVPQIPQLARGGVVNRATTALIGEDGAEAVVPLERNTEWIDKVADKLASKQKAVVVNQTNNYSQAHSRYELYKSKQQTAAAVRMALQGV